MSGAIRRLWHAAEHRFGWNTGHVTTWYSRTGVLLVGFCCDGCGEVSSVRPTRYRLPVRVP